MCTWETAAPYSRLFTHTVHVHVLVHVHVFSFVNSSAAALAPDPGSPPPRPRLLLRRRPKLPLHGAHQLKRVVPHARLHHEPDIARVADVVERIAAHDDEIGPLAGGDRAEAVADAERAGAVQRRYAQRAGWWDARQHQRVQLAVDGKRGE